MTADQQCCPTCAERFSGAWKKCPACASLLPSGPSAASLSAMADSTAASMSWPVAMVIGWMMVVAGAGGYLLAGRLPVNARSEQVATLPTELPTTLSLTAAPSLPDSVFAQNGVLADSAMTNDGHSTDCPSMR